MYFPHFFAKKVLEILSKAGVTKLAFPCECNSKLKRA